MTRLPGISRRTERLLLRPLASDDEEEYVRVFEESSEAWRPWLPAALPRVEPAEHFRRELTRTARGAEAGTHLRLAAFDEEGRLVGLFALNEIVRGVFQSAYASWQVSAPRMRRGYGTEGVKALLDIAFDRVPEGVDLHRVQANIMPSNAASLAMARKIGFRREGLAERYLEIAGTWEDHVMTALTREEWQSRR